MEEYEVGDVLEIAREIIADAFYHQGVDHEDVDAVTDALIRKLERSGYVIALVTPQGN